MTRYKDTLDIEVFTMHNPGNTSRKHRHNWIPLSEHPRGGEVAFAFMLESEEQDKIEMCTDCHARRVKG